MTEQTLGEYRVGVDFNPTGSEAVHSIKHRVADLITDMEALKTASLNINPEVIRLLALAQTAFEEGAMWAVKALTKPAR
jgi:hypothetical protein